MQIESFFQTMSDGFELFVNRWIVDEGSDVKGVVCFCHGMQEHIMRYDRIATYFTEHGYIFNAYDQRGHGKTALSKELFGYIADDDGFNWMVSDVKEHLDLIKKEIEEENSINRSNYWD